jgi:hypothetical protein
MMLSMTTPPLWLQRKTCPNRSHNPSFLSYCYVMCYFALLSDIIVYKVWVIWIEIDGSVDMGSVVYVNRSQNPESAQPR